MRPLRFAINVTLDGCIDHRVGVVDEELHRRAATTLASADALLFGRVTYQMMESAWRRQPGGWPAWMAPWMVPFAEVMDAAKKYVVSRTLEHVDWNTELVRGDLKTAVEELKRQPGKGIAVAGAQLGLALANLGLIDEYELSVHPVIAGTGPTLFAGLRERMQLRLVDRHELASGVVALRYLRT